ncbi:WD40 repeat domain-containing protein [Armatimonas rosea]|uniref:WD40 repeat protein n=1 Tax=Armatimonas rosea TaxID=685828 RepID=A0A7W9SM92_ARMRO|nr:WD40 repeat domain-containing protein [Armatimonas rosea]MBB6048774.1 WD40 repeat protein [Armatimonas rosea]
MRLLRKLLNRPVLEKFLGTQLCVGVFSADSTVLYGGGFEFQLDQHHGWLWAWETATGKLLWESKVEGPVYSLALSPDGKTLLTAGVQSANSETWGAATLWEAQTGALRQVFQTSEGAAQTNDVFFTPDGARVLGGFQTGIQVWETVTGAPLDFWQLPAGKTGWPSNLHFSKDGSMVLVAATGWNSGKAGVPGGEGFVQLWDAHSGAMLSTFPSTERYAALSRDGKHVVLAKQRLQKRRNNHSERLWRVALHAVGSDLPQAESPELPAAFDLTALAFTHDGMVVLNGEFCKPWRVIRPWHFLWNPITGKLSATEPPLEDVSPDGKIYLKCNGGGYQSRPPLGTLFATKTHQKLCDLEGRAGYA